MANIRACLEYSLVECARMWFEHLNECSYGPNYIRKIKI